MVDRSSDMGQAFATGQAFWHAWNMAISMVGWQAAGSLGAVECVREPNSAGKIKRRSRREQLCAKGALVLHKAHSNKGRYTLHE
eukprot:1137139-Pelagomonas_calceolata.AAC.4